MASGLIGRRSQPGSGFGPNLAELLVFVAFEGKDPSEKPMRERDHQALGRFKLPDRVERIIVRLGVDTPEGRRFIGGNAEHSADPFSASLRAVVEVLLDVCEQKVVIPLQGLMIPSLPAKVHHKLKRADDGNDQTDPSRVDRNLRHDLAEGGRAEHDNNEVENTIPPLKRAPASRVIQGVAQNIEAKKFAVHGSHFLVGGGPGGDGVGCLGPTEAPPSLGARIADIDGWRTPRDFSSVIIGCRGPIEFREIRGPFVLSVIRIVLGWWLHSGMKGVGGRLDALRRRQFNRNAAVLIAARTVSFCKYGEAA